MKRMSEVFELPVDEKTIEVYCHQVKFGVKYEEAEKYAAKAINNSDALADALEYLLIHAEKGVSNIVINKSARAVLEAYRGEK